VECAFPDYVWKAVRRWLAVLARRELPTENNESMRLLRPFRPFLPFSKAVAEEVDVEVEVGVAARRTRARRGGRRRAAERGRLGLERTLLCVRGRRRRRRLARRG
jgi:hypothetical protein